MAGFDAHATPWRAFQLAVYGRVRTLCPERKLKIVRPVSRQVLNPGFRSATDDDRCGIVSTSVAGLEKLVLIARNQMTIHQPEMRREDGAIFLTVAENDRLGIATSIERLIDLLDAMSPDPDLEPDADTEEEESGYGDADGMGADESGEPELGWTAGIDQTSPDWSADTHWVSDGEPELGWTGIATGWREGDSVDVIEPNGDELDFNGDEHDFSGGENDPPGFIWGGGEGGGRAHEGA
ncbi:hypothetical protein [Mesorhizobium sp. M0138]|uniref:hypothetical protein n=1 Tax=Mesorhizobium sp. M0138 TaxID=2956891 RepID=UPI00333B6193